MDNPRIAVVLGSRSDLKLFRASKMWEVFTACLIPWRLAVLSAHRHDNDLWMFCEEMQHHGVCAIIGAAGMTPALPGALAAKTGGAIPILGVPLSTASPDSFMAIYGITGLPPRTVAAAFGFNEPGLINAAIFAAQLVALVDGQVAERLAHHLKNKALEKPPEYDIPLAELEKET